MPRMIHLKPIQAGDACYLQDHHNRNGECLLTVTMCDGCATADHAQEALFDVADTLPSVNFGPAQLASVTAWCAEQWQLAQADMPAGEDRDTDGDDSDRYLDCHILATWEV